MTGSALTAIAVMALSPVLGAAQVPPRLPTTCANCWPTECGAGKWRATGPLHGQFRPTDSLPSTFSIDSGQTFEVDSSIIRVTQFGRAVVRTRRGDYVPGDTVLITSYSGEGHYGIWWRGRLRNERSFWERPSSVARLLAPLHQQWWIHVRHKDAQGWISASDSTPAHNVDCP